MLALHNLRQVTNNNRSKYDVVEYYYMEGSTPDSRVVFYRPLATN